MERDKRVSIAVPNEFRTLAKSQFRSVSNLAQIAFEEYVQRHGGTNLNGPKPAKKPRK